MRLFPRKDAQAGPETPPRPKVQVLGGIEPEFDAPETVRQRFMPLAVRRELSRLIWRGFAVLLFIVALVLALALVSHHPLDASANVATAASTQNWLGSFGAYVSDLLIQGFGIAAWGLPAIPLVWALAVARTLRIVAPLRRVLWAGLFMVALAVSLALILPTEVFAGGAAGFLIVSFLPWTLVKVLAFPFAFLGTVWAGGRAICFSMGALRAIFLTPSATLMMSADRARGVVRGGAGGLRWFWRMVRRTPAQGEAQPLDPSIPSFLSSGPESLDPFAAKATQPVTPAAQAYQPPFAEPPQQPAPWQELEPNAAFQAEAEAGFPTYHETLDDEPVPSQEQGPEGEYTAADETQGSAIAAQPKAKLVETPQQAKLRAEPVAKPATHKTASAATATYAPPSLDLLYEPTGEDRATAMTQEEADMFARRLEATLKDYGVKGEIVRVLPGPVVTLYELEPAPGTKTSRVVGLADDIARSMAALSARIAPVPGKSVIGIELPNPTRETVFLQELLADAVFAKSKAALPLALGKDIGGQSVMADLSKMPHLLVAGTTGSGKSVAVNTMILSLVYALSPEQVRFIMIDPKILELSVYDGIPHLLSPVVTDPKKAVVALKWVVQEMNQRYQNMSDLNVRNIANYNGKIQAALAGGETLTRQVQVGFCPDSGEPIMEEQAYNMRPLPHIVVVVDEMAELMLMVGKDIEAAIQSIAQKARAAGIHMIMATQRPSVDVITGTIKANFPSRISFAVSSKIDSRTVLNEMGAEQLLGQGDMLFQPNGGRTMRVHGPFASDDEVEAVVASLKQVGEPEYIEAITNEDVLEAEAGPDGLDLPLFETESSGDDLYDQAVQVVLKDKKASTSHVQRRLQIGYNRAANLIDRMEDEGLITPADHVGRRKIIVPGDSAEA